MLLLLHTVLLHPLLPKVSVLWQVNVLQVLALLLAACAAHRGLTTMTATSQRIRGSGEVMLSLVLLCCVLVSALPIWEDVTSGAITSLVVRCVLGGVFVQGWHVLRQRMPLRMV